MRPRDMVEFQLVRLWRHVLPAAEEGMSLDTKFFQAGGSSLQAAVLIKKVRDEFGVDLTLAQFLKDPTIKGVASAVRSAHRTGARDGALVVLAEGSENNLFFVHGRSGEVYFLAPAITAFEENPTAPTLVGVRSRGLEGEEEPLSTFESMARYYVSEIVRMQPRGPYLLAGFCLGGAIAWEMARQLLAAGREVASLRLFDTYPPGSGSPVNERELLIAGRHPTVEGLAKTQVVNSRTDFAVDSWETIVAELKEQGLLPAETEALTYARRMQVIGRNIAAYGDYSLTPLDVDVTVMFGSAVPGPAREAAVTEFDRLSRSLEVYGIDVGHGDFFTSPRVHEVMTSAVRRRSGADVAELGI